MDKKDKKEDEHSNNLKFVIVGHIDHGKSTLIGRLLYDTDSLPEGKMEEIKMICESLGKDIEFGFIMDNLEEERDQGITIDTAQIFFNSEKRQYTIIDAPGHVEFVKNMITGASQAEAAILIVDAEEGVQEQTRRHAYILSMLGLKQVMIVINKMDIIEYDRNKFHEINKELLGFLGKIDIKPDYIVPISSKEGDNIANRSKNMDWYTGPTVLEALDKFSPQKSGIDRPMRFSVQDIYKRDKRIIAGRVETGILKPGEEIVIMPSGEKTTITSIEEFLSDNIKQAEAGRATGIVTKDTVFIDRGDVVCHPGKLPIVTSRVKAHIFWMDKNPLKKGERIVLKCSTQQAICEVEDFSRILDSSTLEVQKDTDEIKNRQVADVVLKTDKPVVVENFNEVAELGRFVLERLNTCAGGIITEVGNGVKK